MPRAKRPLAEMDPNAPTSAPKRTSSGTAEGKENTVLVDYSKETVSELKERLKDRELPSSGKKADLVERCYEPLHKGAIQGRVLA